MTTAALIDRLLCDRCGHSRVLPNCTCRPDNPHLLASFAAHRHHDAVRLAAARAARRARDTGVGR